MGRFISTVVITILFAQIVLCKDIDFKSKNSGSITTKYLLRDNIWNSIKTSAQNAWKLVENLVENTKHKINSWINNVVSSANTIKENMEVSLQEIKNKSQIMLEDMLGETKIVKKCIKENGNAIDTILKKILENVRTCISDNIDKVATLNRYHFELETKLNINNTVFMKLIENEFNNCIIEHDDEECIEIVNKLLFEEFNNIETGILATRSESRNVADNALDTILYCSKDGFMNASVSIAMETLQVVKCIINNQEQVSVYE